VHMENPDFVTIARGYGIPGQRVSERDALDQAIDSLLDSDGPYFLEVMVDKTDNVFPMIPAGAAVNEIRLG
jgi:acetolactate synthase-1/2/3 large subunit